MGDYLSWVYVLSFIIYVLDVIGMWKIYAKANVAGWLSIIPIVNIYFICKIAMSKNVVLFTILSIFFPIVLIYVNIKLAQSFGKGTGYGILLWLFGFIFYPVLGFSADTYQGAK